MPNSKIRNIYYGTHNTSRINLVFEILTFTLVYRQTQCKVANNTTDFKQD